MQASRSDSREKLILAARDEIRRKGYTATRVEDICRAAGVTKGSFFHHFSSKDALGAAAVDAWRDSNEIFFATAPYQEVADPVERLIAHIAFRREMLNGPIEGFSCLVGTMAQELFATNNDLMPHLSDEFEAHIARLTDEIRAAQEGAGLEDAFSARGLALHMQAVVQGAFIVAKAADGAKDARQALDHLENYIRLLFGWPARERL